MADTNNNTSWSISLNVSGTRPATGEVKNVPTGFYKGTIIEAYTMDSRPERLVLKIEMEGEYQGAIRTTGLNFPKDPNDKVRYYWRAFMESLGYTPAQLDSGAIELRIDAVKGRTVHFKYIEEDKSTNSRDQVNWFPPSDWIKAKASFVPGAHISRPQARPVVVDEGDTSPLNALSVTGPSNGMGGGLGHGDLLSALNVR